MTAIVKGFENYTVTDTGEVYNNVRNKPLSMFLHRRGYLMVSLFNGGKKRNIYVHRLVAEAFIPNPENKPTINHKNENKLINDVSNLEWLTVRENNAYGTRVERIKETWRKKRQNMYKKI